MEFLVILFMGAIIATTNVILPEPKDNNQLEEAKVVQTKNIESPVVKVKPEELVKKPELVKEEVKPVPIQKEETSWLNIILYVIGVVAAIAAGIYFFVRNKTTLPINVADATKREFDDGTTPTSIEQQETQQETQEETQSNKTTEEKPSKDDSSDNNNKQ